MSASKKQKLSTESSSNLSIDLTNLNKHFQPFPHPFIVGDYGDGCTPKTLIELDMMRLSGAIRSKPNWFEKCKDSTIRNKWKQEALQQNSLSEKQIDYVLAELEYYDSIRENAMEMSAIDGVWQSDALIPDDIKGALIDCVSRLENIPEEKKDWHPGTNNQILDLVHPSLFCYVNQTTRIVNDNHRILDVENALESIGQGELIDISSPANSANNYTRSNTYQWLPSEFRVSEDGQVKIESYINNLHPIEHGDLYRLIEEIFQRFIPLFNRALTDLIDQSNKPNRIQVDPYEWYADSPSIEDDGHDGDPNERRTLNIPDVGEFHMPSPVNSPIDLRGTKLQVIVKLANIVLTPANPSYAGGVWHVEGMENEHIVASGIYYYSSSNITQSNLQFRTMVQEPDYEQNDDRGVRAVYGLVNEGALNQPLGELITQEDRCIAFPNLHQHRVAPFQLQDPTKPGLRRILVFFLVDPSIRILSTANIPPQQSHWLVDLVRSLPRFQALPSLVVDKIMSYIDVPMSFHAAKQHREKLMAERKYFISQNNEIVFERPFSLCEH